MIVVMKPDTPRAHTESIMARIKASGCRPLYLPGTERIVIGAIGDERAIAALRLEADPFVESIKPVLSRHKLVSREFHPHDTIVDLGGVKLGGDRLVVIAGPAMVESDEQLEETARVVKSGGALCLCAGVFGSAHDPYAFRGLGAPGLETLARVARENGLPCLTEVVGADSLDMVVGLVDGVTLDEGSIRDTRLLQALGRAGKPVLLARGLASDLEELLLAAEHIVAAGNGNVLLCERGIRTFERATRATLDLSAVPYLKQRTHLPVLVDLSRSLGHRELVPPMAKAAVACGADGLIVPVHRDPAQAHAHGPESLYPQQFADLMHALRPFLSAAGRLP